MTNYNRLPTF